MFRWIYTPPIVFICLFAWDLNHQICNVPIQRSIQSDEVQQNACEVSVTRALPKKRVTVMALGQSKEFAITSKKFFIATTANELGKAKGLDYGKQLQGQLFDYLDTLTLDQAIDFARGFNALLSQFTADDMAETITNPALRQSDKKQQLLKQLQVASLISLYDGHNELAKYIKFSEPSYIDRITDTVDNFVTKRLFDRGLGAQNTWWRSPEHTAHINGRSSKSPLKLLYGETENATREIWWPTTLQSDMPYFLNTPEFAANKQGMHIAINNVGDMPQSLEVFVFNKNADDGRGRWEPFFYLRKNNQWIPAETFGGKPLREACAQCHAQGDYLSPLPTILKNERDFLDVGYTPEAVDAIMKYLGHKLGR